MQRTFLQKIRKIPSPPNNGAVFLPILSLMLILIPILVGNLAFSHLRILNINLPDDYSQNPSTPKKASSSNTKVKVILLLTLKRNKIISEVIEEASGKVLSKKYFPPTEYSKLKIQMELGETQSNYEMDTVLISSHKDIKYDQIVGVLESCRMPSAKHTNSKVNLVLLPSEGV